MAVPAIRLLSSGSLLVNGSVDEQTDNLVYNSNLRLYLNASKTSSYPGTGTTWTDLSGNGYNATLSGTPTYSTGAITFNGSSQSANVPIAAVPSGGSQVSVCVWVNLGNPASPPAASVFACYDSAGNRIINIHLPWNDSIVYWDAGNSGGTYNRISTSTLTLAQKTGWHHWAFTLNATAGTMAIYLDGTSIASGTGKTLTLGTVSTATYPCAIASFNNTPNWNGSVSSFEIYNVALTAAQVSQNYGATSAPFTKFKTASTTAYATEFDEVTYNPASTTANGGRYNLSSYSNYFAFDGTLGWNNIFTAGATLTTGIAAPDSSSTAVRFSCNNTTNALLRVYITSFTPDGSSTYTMSFYARHVSGTKTGCISDLADGVSFDYSSTLVTGSWVRITYSGIPTATGKSFIDLFSDANTNNVIEYWGVQIQQASSVSIYQPIYNNLVTPPFARREGSTGTLYVTSQFDEVSLPAGSISFNGTSRYLSTPSSSANNFGTGDFTVEMWVNPTALSTYNMLFVVGTNYLCLLWGLTSSVYGLNAYNGVQNITSNAVTTPINQWAHVAFVRLSGTMYFYINGVALGSSGFSSAFGSTTNATIGFSTGYPGQYYYNGLISNLRVVNGTAVYTAAFTPPQSILPSITNTQLLLNVTESANFIKDNSPNNFTLTNNGPATWTTSGPFNGQ